MTTRYLVAVSGGVDSVVLLDMMTRLKGVKLIVAHFDHGIRNDSAEDAAFVADLAQKYDVAVEMKREELGPKASEETARNRRYAFLRDMAKKHTAKIVTAHHADDVVETIAINLHRGTGWRGLAVLDSKDIERPLLTMTKRQIVHYAKKRGLEWREDSTNADHRYLRNRLRDRLVIVDPETKQWVNDLRDRQVALKAEIDTEASKLIGMSPYSRYFFTHINDTTAIELLGAVCKEETGTSPTTPRRKRALHAIKVAKAGTTYDVAEGIKLRFTRTEFVVERSL